MIYIIFKLVPKNYSINYKIDGISIIESYRKKEKNYLFGFTSDKHKYEYIINNKYSSKRRLVSSVKEKNNCISFKVNKEKYSICNIKDTLTMEYVNNSINNKVIDKYKNIKIYDYNNSTYYIWNYEGFLSVEKNNTEELNIFDKDIYELSYIEQVKNLIVVADYNEDYFFNKFYIIDMSKNKYTTEEVNAKLSFDGYILGNYNNSVYMYDNKTKKTYTLNPFKSTFNVNSNKILVNGSWESISLNKLSKKTYKFTYAQNNYYEIIEDYLYYNNGLSIKVFNNKVDRIICQDSSGVYFISDGKMYFNNFEDGNKLIMEYSEWNFNNKNIYIYNN